MDVVDPDRSGFQSLGGQVAIPHVSAEEVGAEPEHGVIGVFEGLVQVVSDLHEGQHRPEGLFGHHP
ncbi:MAG TPA: hypothetical protein VJK02_14155, partial [Anaerolineales bacterium]|nr:hypothetical protein [Anaerolineales bacterium]